MKVKIGMTDVNRYFVCVDLEGPTRKWMCTDNRLRTIEELSDARGNIIPEYFHRNFRRGCQMIHEKFRVLRRLPKPFFDRNTKECILYEVEEK